MFEIFVNGRFVAVTQDPKIRPVVGETIEFENLSTKHPHAVAGEIVRAVVENITHSYLRSREEFPQRVIVECRRDGFETKPDPRPPKPGDGDDVRLPAGYEAATKARSEQPESHSALPWWAELVDAKNKALDFANRYGGIDGDHHKSWVIDQMVRALTGIEYNPWVRAHNNGEDGPETYGWDVGVAP